ncbi:hypothetical protein E3P99_02808 [Wallemia hederae]|uniref:UBC core domain-containing protein n=1 Tax=Wallemia hederae TaxID=1540922 RepID=A0A4T0FK90_9BASI|nr:hypothetical protein E3P99_02808 [Wallemia hederae]
MSVLATKRLSKELKDLKEKGCPAGIHILQSDDLHKWIFQVEAYDSIYGDEKFALMFRFSAQYPIDAPAVQFVVGSLDGDAGGVYKAPGRRLFRFTLNLNRLSCIPISTKMDIFAQASSQMDGVQCSMLHSCKSKELPPDNDRYVARAPENPKKTRWEFHDDTV